MMEVLDIVEVVLLVLAVSLLLTVVIAQRGIMRLLQNKDMKASPGNEDQPESIQGFDDDFTGLIMEPESFSPVRDPWTRQDETKKAKYQPGPSRVTLPIPRTVSRSETCRVPLQDTCRVPLPQTSSVPLPQTCSVPLPQTSSVPLPQTCSVPLPQTSSVPLPQTCGVALPETFREPLPETCSVPMPETYPEPLPETSLDLSPDTSLDHYPETCSVPLPETWPEDPEPLHSSRSSTSSLGLRTIFVEDANDTERADQNASSDWVATFDI